MHIFEMKLRQECVATMVASAMALALLPATQAQAADIVSGVDPNYVGPAIDPVENASLWNGVYGGLQGGYKWQSVGVMGGADVNDVNGEEIGGYVGYNRAIGDALVGGIELQGGYSKAKSTAAGITVDQDFETSLRARMGYAFEQNLIYGLAGLSAARLELNDGIAADRNWMTGYTVGAGVERAFSKNIIGRVEYDYSDYGSKQFTLGGSTPDVDLKGHALKLGVGVKF